MALEFSHLNSMCLWIIVPNLLRWRSNMIINLFLSSSAQFKIELFGRGVVYFLFCVCLCVCLWVMCFLSIYFQKTKEHGSRIKTNPAQLSESLQVLRILSIWNGLAGFVELAGFEFQDVDRLAEARGHGSAPCWVTNPSCGHQERVTGVMKMRPSPYRPQWLKRAHSKLPHSSGCKGWGPWAPHAGDSGVTHASHW